MRLLFKIQVLVSTALCLSLVIYRPEPLQARTAGKKRVTVLQFIPENTPQSYGNIVRNYVEMKLHSEKDLLLLEREQVNTENDIPSLRKYGCNDSTCAVLAGRSLTANYVIYGSVSRSGPYTITIRVLSVEDEKVLSEYHETFRNSKATKKTVEKLTRRVLKDIRIHERGGTPVNDRNQPAGSLSFFLETNLGLAILQPLGKLNDLVGTGFGLNTGITFTKIAWGGVKFPAHLQLGFDTAFTISRGRDNEEDSFTLMPFLITAGYYFDIIHDFYAIPQISAGISYLRFSHAVGHGFDMEDNTVRNAVDPSLRFALTLGYNMSRNISIETSLSYGLLIESSAAVHTLFYGAGIKYRFNRIL